MNKLTRAQAEQVMTELRAHYRHTLADWDGGDLALVKNWDYPDEPRDWAIVWEEGPHAWAYEFVHHYNGADRPHTEAYSQWAICLYPPN